MLPTPPTGVQPGPTDFLSEDAQAVAVPRHCVVVEVSLNHAAQPVKLGTEFPGQAKTVSRQLPPQVSRAEAKVK